MDPILVLYLGTTFTSVITSLPQIVQLWVIKKSDQFNLFSWGAWSVAQIAALFYSISIQAWAYVIVNILWIGFYAVMIYLIIKFRHGATAKLGLAAPHKLATR